LNIWLSDLDGSNPVQLTDLDRLTGTPRWSPDGRQIAFDSRPGEDSEIYVISAEGGAPRRMTNHPANDVVPTWSRDGKWIYFSSDRSGQYQVWKMPVEGGTPIQITRGGGLYALEALEGHTLYFSKWGGIERSGDGLWKVAVEGGDETRILDRAVFWSDWDLAQGGIYFLSKNPRPGGEEWAIELLNLENGKVRELYRQDSPNFHESLAVSPDERWILYGESTPQEADIMLVENFR
jgi:Tol biopolymer transport system component